MKLRFELLVLVLATRTAFADEGRPVRDAVTTATAPSARPLEPRAPIVAGVATLDGAASGSSGVAAKELALRATLPLVRGDTVRFGLQLGYAATELDTTEPTTADRRSLHRFDLGVGGSVKLGESFDLRGNVLGSHASDLNASTSKALQAAGTLVVRWHPDESTAYFFGLGSSTQLSVTPLFPVLGLVHQAPGSPFRIEVMLPQRAVATWDFNERLRGLAGLELDARAWAVQQSDGSYDRVTRRQGLRASAGIQIRIFDDVRFDARGGVSAFAYELETAVASRALDLDPKAAPYAQLGLVITP